MSSTPHVPQIRCYQAWLHEQRGLVFADYDALWRWSSTDLAAFWQGVWDYFDLQSPTPHRAVLEGDVMPHVRWFPGAQVNCARQVFRQVARAEAAGPPTIIAKDELGRVRTLGWHKLQRRVAAQAVALRALGVQRGDRVAAYLPNRIETVVAVLACASIGAIWSVCAPDMGTAAVLDRFRQIEPTVLIAADGVHHGGRPLDRGTTVRELRAGLPTVAHVVTLRTPYAAERVADTHDLACERPIPSMPLYFWNDEGHARYLSSDFDTYPGVWRHGDWLEVRADGGCVIDGRSDATLKRHGLRIGTNEIHAAMAALPAVLHSLVIDLEFLGRESVMPLFVVLRLGQTLDEPLERVLNRDAMANPLCLGWYAACAAKRSKSAGTMAA